MRKFATLVFLWTLSVPAIGLADYLKPITGDYCKDDIVLYFEQRFGSRDHLKKLIYDKAADKDGVGWVYWAETDLCDGNILFKFGATNSVMCKSPHYYSRPQYLVTAVGMYGCSDLVSFWGEYPDIVYPY